MTEAPSGIAAALERHPRRVFAALVGGAVFVRLILCLQVAATPLPRMGEIILDSDNRFFDEWGARIAGGDLLQREPLHPTTRWMREVAAEALAQDPQLPARLGLAAAPGADRAAMEVTLWDRWLGGTTFYQEPAYPYLVGLTYALTGRNVWHVFAWQLALGVAGVWLVHRLALRLFSATAAAAAGAFAVLAPIPLLYEVTLLRDALVVVVTLALAWLMHWAVGGGPRRWLVLGLAFGGAALVKQTFLVLPLAMAAWRLVAVRSPARDRAIAAGLVAAGMALAMLPAILRNVAVGAPALAMNGSAAGMLALYHIGSATPFDLVVNSDLSRVLAATGGGFPSLVEAVKTHASPWGFCLLLGKKLLYAWHGFEAPNNVDFYIFRQGAPLLAALPATFAVLLPLAAIGAASRRAAEAWPIFLSILGCLPTLILGAVFSRYRAPLTACLLPLAGAGAVELAAWVPARRWGRMGTAAAAAALYLWWATGSPPGKSPPERARSYALHGASAISGSEPVLATLYLREALRLEPGTATSEALLAKALLQTGDTAEALKLLASAARSLDSAGFNELYARALASAGRREEAIARARAAVAADPSGASRSTLLAQLEREAAAADRQGREEKP